MQTGSANKLLTIVVASETLRPVLKRGEFEKGSRESARDEVGASADLSDSGESEWEMDIETEEGNIIEIQNRIEEGGSKNRLGYLIYCFLGVSFPKLFPFSGTFPVC